MVYILCDFQREEDLYNHIFVLRELRFEKDHEVFIYTLEEAIPYDEAVAFAKLRAIENRIAVVIKTPKYLIGAKANRYKGVQLFRGKSIKPSKPSFVEFDI